LEVREEFFGKSGTYDFVAMFDRVDVRLPFSWLLSVVAPIYSS